MKSLAVHFLGLLLLACLGSSLSGWAMEISDLATPLESSANLLGSNGRQNRNPIKEFHEVVPGIYRGGRPGREGIAYLARLGVRTDINIEDDSIAITQERPIAGEFGMTFISIPFSAKKTPVDKDVDQVLSLLNDSANYPIFLHCKHGQDRTGMIVGLYRVLYQNWQPETAYKEMKAYGFHPILFPLTRYFKQRTGLSDDLQLVSEKQDMESVSY